MPGPQARVPVDITHRKGRPTHHGATLRGTVFMQVHEQNQVTLITILNEECGALLKTVEPMLEKGSLRYVFDMSQVTFLNSVNIAAIIATRNRIVATGGKVVVSNLADNIKAVFRILKLERLFDLTFNLEEALAAVR
jgi:anti-anti-sigma factor